MRVLVALSLLLAACEPPPPPAAKVPGTIEKTGDVVMTVEGETVTADMVDAITRRAPPDQLEQLKANEMQYREFLERIALGQALYKKAVDAKLHEDADVQKAIAMNAREILASELLEDVAKKAVTEEKIKETYETKKVQYAKPSAKVMQIIVPDEAQAKQVAEQLRGGADFMTMASQYSMDKGQNADMGWVEKGRLLPELDKAVFEAEAGAIVGPVTTRHGSFILKVAEKRDSTPMEEVRPALEEQIKREAVEAYVKTVQDELKIEWPEKKAEPAGDAPTDGEAPAEKPAEGAAPAPEGAAHGAGDGHGH